MRTLYVRKDSLSAKGATVVRDEDHRSIYLLIGRWGRRPDTLSLYQISGTLMAELRQTNLGLLPQFDIYYQNQKVGRIAKRFGFFNEFIYISNLRWIVVGNFLTGHYKIYHGTTTIMTADADDDQMHITCSQKSYEPVCLCIAATRDHWANRRTKFKLPGQAWDVSFNVPNDMRGNRAWHYEHAHKKYRVLK